MIEGLTENKERPSYVRFERRAVESPKLSAEAGHYVAVDIDYALITSPGSKDVFHTKVSSWWVQLQQDVQNQRIPQEWVDLYKKHYNAWKNGQEMPLNGTPIRGWGVISPAKQETLIAMSIMTVEDLAVINDDGMKRIGMGAVELKTKAKAWLSQLQDKGPLTQEIAAVTAENRTLKASLESLQKQVEALMSDKPEVRRESEEITASDLVDDPVELYTAKFGKPPHHRMKPESILAPLKE